MPFGAGSRACAGVHLVHIFVRIIVAAISRNFDIVIPAETTPESMEQRFAFVSFLVSQSWMTVTLSDILFCIRLGNEPSRAGSPLDLQS